MARNPTDRSESTLSWLNLIIGLWLLGLGIWALGTGQSSLWNFVRIVGGLFLLRVEERKWFARRTAAKQQAAADTAAANKVPLQ